MTIAELKKELEKYNDNDIVVTCSRRTDPWSGQVDVFWYEVANMFKNNDNYAVITPEKWEKMDKGN